MVWDTVAGQRSQTQGAASGARGRQGIHTESAEGVSLNVKCPTVTACVGSHSMAGDHWWWATVCSNARAHRQGRQARATLTHTPQRFFRQTRLRQCSLSPSF